MWLEKQVIVESIESIDPSWIKVAYHRLDQKCVVSTENLSETEFIAEDGTIKLPHIMRVALDHGYDAFTIVKEFVELY